jgi:hypothetical protein
MIEEGGRNNYLLRRGLHIARDCATAGELLTILRVANEAECAPPLGWNEVERIASSAWKYQVEGRNWVGGEPRIVVSASEFDALVDYPDALLLHMQLRRRHEGRRETFCASPKGMAEAKVMPDWRHPQRYRKAIAVLLERGIWIRTREGGRGARDPHEYRFAPRGLLQAKGAPNAPNTNHTPSPLPSCPELKAPLIRRAA